MYCTHTFFPPHHDFDVSQKVAISVGEGGCGGGGAAGVSLSHYICVYIYIYIYIYTHTHTHDNALHPLAPKVVPTGQIRIHSLPETLGTPGVGVGGVCAPEIQSRALITVPQLNN